MTSVRLDSDWTERGLGCAQAGGHALHAGLSADAVESLTGVAECQCSRNGGFSGLHGGSQSGRLFASVLKPGTVEWLCRLRLDDGPGGEVTLSWDKRTKALDVLCAEGQ